MSGKPRLFSPSKLAAGEELALSATAARHVQVLRLQPGHPIILFDGSGGEFEASITHMGRHEVQVRAGQHVAIERESRRALHLALGVPANERMDWLVEKATELGVVSIQPLQTERSVLRLSGERLAKRHAHWQAIAVAACEQCGRNQIPTIHKILKLSDWLLASPRAHGLVLSFQSSALPLHSLGALSELTLLSGPEGGLSADEELGALGAGFTPVSLGPRTLRAETAPLAALAALTLGP